MNCRACAVTFSASRHLIGQDSRVAEKQNVVEIDCYEVRRELVDYMEDDLTPELRTRIERHLESCRHCTAVYDGVRNVVALVGSDNAIELPPGLSQRLYKRFLSRVR